jgi:hypothetical protein
MTTNSEISQIRIAPVAHGPQDETGVSPVGEAPIRGDHQFIAEFLA